jgi:RND family efflux transporter MFP subunit
MRRHALSSPTGAVSRGLLIVLTVVVVAVVVAGWGITSRARALKGLTEETRELNTVTVTVTAPRPGSPEEEIVLPGTLQAFADAPIYARTNGYLKRRLVDIGARVKAGQLLAEIDAPELVRQLQQARADLATAEANLKLAQLTADRYRELVKTDSVTQQDADDAIGAYEARRATFDSARHNVERLEQLEGFTRLYAPIDGVITVRNTDVGALIDPGSAGGPARELFHISSTGTLRLFVSVPERYAPVARPGLRADLTLAEFQGRRFSGTLVRTSAAIEVSSRTLLAEFEVPNPGGELLPGSYVQAHIKLPKAASTLTLPVSTLIFRGGGTQVAVVTPDSKVAMTRVAVGRDFGTEVEVLDGLAPDARVVVSPPDSLVDKQPVRVAAPAANPEASGASPAPKGQAR